MWHEKRLTNEHPAWLVRTAVRVAFVGGCLAFCGGDDGLVAGEPPDAADSTANEKSERLPADVRTKLAGRLKHPAANTRIAALREIGEYHSVDAVQLVLSYGLRDRTPEVHDAAVRVLLRDKTDARVGLYLISQWELEATTKQRQNQAYMQRLLEVACEFRVPEVYRELLQRTDQGNLALAGGVLEAMMASMDRAAAEKDAALLPILQPVAASDTYQRSFGFRRSVIDAVANVRHVDAVTFLVRQLRDEEGELRRVIVQNLRRITRQTFSSDAEAWDQWWQAERAQFEFTEEKSLAVREYDVEQETPYYYDIPIYAQRLVFVLDTSRSMSAATTISRLDAAKRELIQAIEKLPENTLFNVIVYNTGVARWSDKLSPATPNLKLKAIQFVRSQQPTGKTATYDALLAAFKIDPQLEAIYLLSDGKPSAGKVVQPAMLIDAIHKDNRTRRLTINTIGVIGPAPDALGLEEFMRQLALQNFGVFHRAE